MPYILKKSFNWGENLFCWLAQTVITPHEQTQDHVLDPHMTAYPLSRYYNLVCEQT